MKRYQYFPFVFGFLLMVGFSSISKVEKKLQNSGTHSNSIEKPNIIFFAVDDMNDFINPLGYSQAITPNLDRLASAGIIFTNAHAPASYCAPSRTAIWTGLQSTSTGCYGDEVFFYDFPNLVPMHEAFQQAGYKTYGAGKLFHHSNGYIDMRGWDQFYTRNETVRKECINTGYHGNDLPLPTPYPHSSYYTKTDNKFSEAAFLESGPIADKDADKMMGAKDTKWICDLLAKKHNTPFFLGLGLYSPHFPNYAPQKYFDLYDINKIQVPELFKGDLDDIPEPMKKRMTNRSKIQKTLEDVGAVKEAVLGYLACVSYADGLLGEVLDALEKSAYKDNTILIFWSDQGYHLGEKGNWGKHTLWGETSRVPFIIAGSQIPKGKRIDNTVGLIDIYPTLSELCNLPKQHKMDGQSILPLIMGKKVKDDRDLFIPYHIRGGYSVINSNYRYIQYTEGGEEFYNRKNDPEEHYNLICDEKNSVIINQMKKAVPNFRKPATSKRDLKLIFDKDYNFHWENKKGEKPQMTL